MGQKGFGHILLILGLLIAVGVAAEVFLLSTFKKPKLEPQSTVMAQDVSSPSPKVVSETNEPSPTPTAIAAVKPINLRQTYTNADYAFSFTYPAVLLVQPDSEESYSKRLGGDNRENFAGYVKYEPGKVLFAATVLGKDANFDNSPFSVWIFDNPNNLNVDQWFEKYWYYPFLWGVFDKTSKSHVTLDQEASISGQPAEYKVVSYQPGAPKYLYLEHGGKMFLIRVLTADHTGESILQSLRFTN